MAHINFRIDSETKAIMDIISEATGIYAAELAKRAMLKELSILRVNLAFKLLQEGKISRKQAWTISGLSSIEFLNVCTNRRVEEPISEETHFATHDFELRLDPTKFRRLEANKESKHDVLKK